MDVGETVEAVEAGNRTQVAIAGAVPIDYTYDAANQLTSDTLHSYSHDAAGNLTSRAPAGQADLATTYGFDSLNRLVNVQDPAGTVVDHAYDNMGRRTRTTTTDPAGNVATDTYLYDGWDLLNTVSSTGDTAYTTVGGRVLAATTALGDIHYHPDAIGNVGEATDDDGNVTTRNAYTPYGESVAISPDIGPDNPGTQYGYSGAWGVRDAGNELLDMRNRMYDPTLGQFLSRDPLEMTTADAYGYAAGDPIGLVDPAGLAPGRGLDWVDYRSQLDWAGRATTALLARWDHWLDTLSFGGRLARIKSALRSGAKMLGQAGGYAASGVFNLPGLQENWRRDSHWTSRVDAVADWAGRSSLQFVGAYGGAWLGSFTAPFTGWGGPVAGATGGAELAGKAWDSIADGARSWAEDNRDDFQRGLRRIGSWFDPRG